MNAGVLAAPALAWAEQQELLAFLYAEARAADESDYDAWEALVDDREMLYWVPGGKPDPQPDSTLSIIADHRERLRNRIAQLKTGRRLAQRPPSPMRRLLGNIEADRLEDGRLRVQCNFALYEFRIQTGQQVHLWAGRCEYRLRRAEDGRLRMVYKRVDLVDAAAPHPSLGFLL